MHNVTQLSLIGMSHTLENCTRNFYKKLAPNRTQLYSVEVSGTKLSNTADQSNCTILVTYILNHISSHFLIPLSDSSLICTVPVQCALTHHFGRVPTQMTESKFRTFPGLFQHHKNKKTPSTHLAKLQAPELF